MRADLEAELDRLFQCPLDQFTAERNALAKRLKQAGRGSQALEVQKLVKPNPAAWLVNQLYFQYPERLRALLDASERLRNAQELRGNLEAITAETRTRGQILLELRTAYRELATASGRTLSPQLERQVASTLEALSSGSEEHHRVLGRLQRDLVPLGFDALGAAAPPQSGGTERSSRPVTARRPQNLELIQELKRQVRQAEREARIATTRAERASQDATDAEERARQARSLAERAMIEATEKTTEAEALVTKLALAMQQLRSHD